MILRYALSGLLVANVAIGAAGAVDMGGSAGGNASAAPDNGSDAASSRSVAGQNIAAPE